MTAKTADDLLDDIDTLFSTNGNGEITGADLHQVATDIVDSLATLWLIGLQIPQVPTAKLLQLYENPSAVGTGTPSSANEALQFNFGVVTPTSSPASYEKMGVISWLITQDPSSGIVFRDCVGADVRGWIASTNTSGRAWGLYAEAVIQSGGAGDGYLVGGELVITNNGGTNEATPDISTSKHVLNIIANGGNNATVGIYFVGQGGSKFYNGIYAKPADIETNFLNLLNAFFVTKNGSLFTAANLMIGANALTLANGLNSNIAAPNSSFSRITGPTGAFSVGGIVPYYPDGQVMHLYNTTSQTMTIVNEDASSTAANRIKTLTGGNVVLRATATSFASLIYDGTGQRWILTSTN